MAKAIEIPEATMLCDTPDCGYTQTVNPRSVRKYVGCTCPRCNAVMVTEEAAQKVEEVYAFADLMNAMVGEVPEGAERANVSTRVDRAGEIAEVNFRRVKA